MQRKQKNFEMDKLAKRLAELSLKSNTQTLRTNNAEIGTSQVIEYLYERHHILLPVNPVFREITQPKAGAGFRKVIESEKYKIYSKTIRDTTYIKFYVNPRSNFFLY